jgi:DNA-binding protein Fis
MRPAADRHRFCPWRALKSVSGNKTEAAKVLGIAYSTLYEKIKKYGMWE